jgi:hypothetical protein
VIPPASEPEKPPGSERSWITIATIGSIMPQVINHGELQIQTIGVSIDKKIQRKRKGTVYYKSYGALSLKAMNLVKTELRPQLQRWTRYS